MVKKTDEKTIDSPSGQVAPLLRVKKDKADLENFELLLETKSQIRGREEVNPSTYRVYHNKFDGVLKGTIESAKSRYVILLGSPNDPSSEMTMISKAVNAMPYQQDFTKRKLMESLPSNLARGNKIKLAIDYLEHVKVIEKSNKKDFETGCNDV